ncbi:hypothetical protein skT53_20520 [Effusibacillus dendaii]|uniref:Uncharacterized protein n=1 Tax=Effusibacillus dendaii TaxID=2743772 RepID=A0A7I8DAQ3_9BACL|nr:hypothetical protein skT53_20520 [Effusibacillus dendaii]
MNGFRSGIFEIEGEWRCRIMNTHIIMTTTIMAAFMITTMAMIIAMATNMTMTISMQADMCMSPTIS